MDDKEEDPLSEDMDDRIPNPPKPPFLSEQSLEDKGRLTVVLDMDETLIHSEFIDVEDVDLWNERKSTADFFLEGIEENRGIAVHVRPGCTRFLEEVSNHYEPLIFTAANEDYASAVLNCIDPRQTLRSKLFREHTCECQGTMFVKDLSMLGRDMRRTVLVDNNLLSMVASPRNSIPISDFYGDKSDNELSHLAEELRLISKLSDVRPFLRKYEILEKLLSHNSMYKFD